MHTPAASRSALVTLAFLAALLAAAVLAPAARAAGSELALTKTADADAVHVGELVEFQIDVVNAGTAGDPRVVVVDPVPSGLEVVGVQSTQGDCTTGQTVSCELGSLATGGAGTVWILAAAVHAGLATNTATVAGDADLGPVEDNADSATVAVFPPEADLGIEMAASALTIPFAGQVTYTLAVSNAGPFAEEQAVVRGTLSSRVTALSVSAAQGSCSVVDRWLDCKLGRIDGGDGTTVTVVARGDASGTAASSLYVAGDPNDVVVDPDDSNDTAGVDTTVLARRPALPLTPILVPAPPPVTRTIPRHATSVSVRRSGRRVTGLVKGAPGCIGRRQVVLRREGKANTRYGVAVTKADGTFAIKTKRRLRGRVYVFLASSYGADGAICSSRRSRRR